MFKKSLATALLVCTVPAVASASWFLSTQARNGGGSIDSPNMAGQTVLNGPLYRSYTTSALPTVTINAAAGNTIRSVTVNGTAYTPDNTTSWTVPAADLAAGGDNSVSALFTVQGQSVGASIQGGTVTPTSVGNIYYGYTLQNPLTFTFSPMAGYQITQIENVPGQAAPVTGTQAVSGTNPGWSVPGGVNAKATVTFPAGYVFTSNVALKGDAVNTTKSLGHMLPQTVVAGSTVKITPIANNLSSPAYIWTYVSGPANETTYTKDPSTGKMTTTVTPKPDVTLTGTSPVQFTAPSTVGQYKFLVQVANGTDSNGKTIYLSSLATVNVLASAADAGQQQCQFCHTANNVAGGVNYAAMWSTSVHAGSTHSICSACHYGTANGSHPGTVNADNIDPATFQVTAASVTGGNGIAVAKGNVFCSSCHSTGGNPLPHSTAIDTANGVTCVNCHTNKQGSATAAAKGDAHLVQPLSCTQCHAIPQTNPFTDRQLVGDTAGNNGVRAVVGEFSKWSHHVVNANGLAVQDEQCAVCHLEGTVGQYGFGVDGTKHMTDNYVHLRNAQTDADMLWDPSTPNHSTMDNFCMSCHSKAGATSPMNAKLQPLITAITGITASPLNPFGDTISNRYDKMQRPRVTDVDDQFNTTNNSHHAVKGKRYSGRTRFAANDGRQIATPATFANNSSALLQGVRSTMFDAGNFNALYVPLGTDGTAATGLGDDSTLHCGDCHTVGQWKVGSSVNAAGQPTPAQIGAHGSNNEYLLRNSLGTDERHVGVAYTASGQTVTITNPNAARLVCFNCHSFNNYGFPFQTSGANLGNAGGTALGNPQTHAGEYGKLGYCNGPGNTIPFSGYTTGAATDGTQFGSRFMGPANAADQAAGYQNPQFGNVMGIQCLSCHNSGIGNAYGGIHGSPNDTDWNGVTAQSLLAANGVAPTGKGYFVDGEGNVNKIERFLPGLNNAMYVPGVLGGLTGGTQAPDQRSAKPYGSTAYVYWNYNTGGVVNDTNWEQKQWQQTANTVINYTTGKVTGTAYAGAGCYTLGKTDITTNVTAGLQGPSVTGPNGAASALMDTWGGCEDHSAAQGGGNHGFLKRVIRPLTY